VPDNNTEIAIRRWKRPIRRSKALTAKNAAIVFGAVLMVVLAASAVSQDAAHQPSGGIAGFVRFPDGTPSAGATVSAITECGQEMPHNLVQEVKTSADGSFYISPFFASSCNRVRLSAKKSDELWLKTGRDVFYERENGTAPVVEAARLGTPTVAEIILGERGALVAFRVRDVTSGNFMWAELYLERRPVPGAKFGSMQIATGKDGSADTLLLPAGQYEISVAQYSCNGAYYFTASPPHETLAVEAGQRVAEDISLDVRRIKVMKSSDNPRGKPCETQSLQTR
jgi:hypothetical protein